MFRSQDTRATLGWPASNLFYQPELEAILRAGLQRFPNVEVRLATEFTALEQSAEGARLKLTSANGGGGFTFAMDESDDDRDADFQR